MDIHFYKTTSECNRINKVLTNEIVLTGNFKDVVDITHPALFVTSNISEYNYCRIPDLERNYFIDRIKIVRTNLYRIDLSLDALTTYKTEILAMTVILERAQGSNPYYSGYAVGYDVRTSAEKLEFERDKFNATGANVLVAIHGKVRV